MLDENKVAELQKPLPPEAITQHPTKTYLSVISPMAVIDRLNSVFGVGGWNYTVEYIDCKVLTTASNKSTYMSAVKGTFEVEGIVLEQFGGSTNEDMGDALKGGATDALTKIASYLGVGADIYKGLHDNKPNQSTNTTNYDRR